MFVLLHIKQPQAMKRVGEKTLNTYIMGCDIHMYVEYKRKDSDKQFRDFGKRINPGRNYYMFGLLAKGVRSDDKNGIEPKGLPDIDTLGYEARWDSILFISETNPDGEKNCSLEQAQSWANYGHKILERDGKPYAVKHPDWHSHSWLTTDEYEGVLKKYYEHPEATKYNEPEYNALLAAMRSLENDGNEVRIVFWFDN